MNVLEAAADAVGAADIEAVKVVLVSNPAYEGRHHEVTNLHTGLIVYLDLSEYEGDDDARPEPAPEQDIAEDLSDRSVADLKGIARRLDVSVAGSKAQLIARIEAALDPDAGDFDTDGDEDDS